MPSRRATAAACLAALALPLSAAAEEDGFASAPEWLSESITRPHSNIATSALPPEIAAMPIGTLEIAAAGVLPASVTGLPRDLWGASETDDIARAFRALPATGLPAILSFTQTLALAEIDPPLGGDPEAELLLARIDLLLDRGALDQARELIERAGPADPRIFRRFFDVSLLTGEAQAACETIERRPDIAPTFPARIFCLARMGDWPAAALALGTGEALGYIDAREADLIARFLDPELFEGAPPLPADPAITPLRYEMRVAIGERPGLTGLPNAFAHSALSEIAGWQAQIDAAERLMRTGALAPSAWQAIWQAYRPSASGAIWDRVRALQALDAALDDGDAEAVAATLDRAWSEVSAAGLEVGFAALYAEPLSRVSLSGEDAALARRIGLLSPRYEAAARSAVPQSAEEAFLFAIARGEAGTPVRRDAITGAVANAFAGLEPPARYRHLLDGNRPGEALLAAASVLIPGTGDADDLADALRLLRAMGLEDTARRAALQLLIGVGGAA